MLRFHGVNDGDMGRREWLRLALGATGSFVALASVPWLAIGSAEQTIAARIDNAPSTHPLIPALKIAAESLIEVEKVRDYTSTLIKNELVGRKTIETKIQLKFREAPKGVYLKFIEPNAGREVIYQPTVSGGNLQVHETGLAALIGTLSLEPTGATAMADNRHPVTEIGIKQMLELVVDQWLKETKLAEPKVNFYPNAKIGNLSCRVVEVTHASKETGASFHITRLYIDSETKLPVRIQNYDFPARAKQKPEVVEDYFYTELRTNVGLTDLDFDVRNPAYKF
ncbi:MAG: DUF1571 domain-containing protein [Planctomycetaceae bacterium]